MFSNQEQKKQIDQNSFKPKIDVGDFYFAKKKAHPELGFKKIMKLYCLYWARELMQLNPGVVSLSEEDKEGCTQQLAKDLWVSLSKDFMEQKKQLQKSTKNDKSETVSVHL